MRSKESALNEFVRVARLASGDDPEFLRRLAEALVRESADAGAPEPADLPDMPEHGDAGDPTEPEASPQAAPEGGHAADVAALAERLAERMDGPRGIILDLATSRIDIARPVLEKSPVLTQGDLTDIIIRQSRKHVMAIASRWDIGPQLADALVAYGNNEVLETVLQNAAIKLSARTLMSLSKRAGHSLQIQNALLGRADLPVAVVSDLLEKMIGEQRNHLLGKLIRVDQVDSPQKFVIPKKTRQSRKFIDSVQLAERLARRRGIDENVLAELASQKKQLELLICCSKLFRIDLDMTLGVLSDSSGLSLATFCRARELNVNTFSQIIVAPSITASPDGARIRALLHYYRRLQVPDAIKAVALWRARHDVGTAETGLSQSA